MNYGFKVKLDNNLFHSIKKGELVPSPGMKYKHYAPKIKCLLIYSEDNNKFIKEVNKIKKEGLGIAIMNRLIRACSHNYIEL